MAIRHAILPVGGLLGIWKAHYIPSGAACKAITASFRRVLIETVILAKAAHSHLWLFFNLR